ncbi:MAG: hypothetical protein K2X82_17950 [Gemmataceae bacterium]|nr:hypothetical protein [Gemmataceae bacterium]
MRRSACVAASALLLAIGGAAATSDPPAAPPVRYKFVENTDRWVGVRRGGWLLIGKLDKDGEFTQEQRIPEGKPWSRGLPAHGLLNGAGPEPRKAYELRHGALVPGEIRKDGAFVPEVGGKIIAFADYQYAPEAPPIWNLPGGFQPVEPPAEKK